MNPEFDRIVRQTGVNPNIYNNQRPQMLPRSNEPAPRPRGRRVNRSIGGSSTTPTTLRVGPLEEADTTGARIIALQSREIDDGLKLIYEWTRTQKIDYLEFEDLMAEVTSKIVKKIR